MQEKKNFSSEHKALSFGGDAGEGFIDHQHFRRYGIMKRGLKGFAFLVSGLVLGIIGATVSATAIALSAVGMAKVRRASK